MISNLPPKQLLTIRGGIKLSGTVRIGGAKNSILPIMAACLLSEEQIVLKNIPNLLDVQVMVSLLNFLGAEVEMSLNSSNHGSGHMVRILARKIRRYTVPERIAGMLRASSLIMGPLLTRFHKVAIPMPGGCTIGNRPVNMHIDSMIKMGAVVSTTGRYVSASTHGGLVGGKVPFPKVSVGATENTLMAAVLARGETIIENAATEPEVVDLSRFLEYLGANISGIGTSRLVIKGVSKLSGGEYSIIPDRLEIGTYALAALVTGGDIIMEGIDTSYASSIYEQFKQLGGELRNTKNGLIASRADTNLRPLDIITGPHPGFPSDMQAQFMAALCLAKGISKVEERIFDNRMQHVLELQKMGARIELMSKNESLVHGVERYMPCSTLQATDLRSTAALILAALTVNGSSTICGIQYMSRGYEDWVQKLRNCGADLYLHEHDNASQSGVDVAEQKANLIKTTASI